MALGSNLGLGLLRAKVVVRGQVWCPGFGLSTVDETVKTAHITGCPARRSSLVTVESHCATFAWGSVKFSFGNYIYIYIYMSTFVPFLCVYIYIYLYITPNSQVLYEERIKSGGAKVHKA